VSMTLSDESFATTVTALLPILKSLKLIELASLGANVTGSTTLITMSPLFEPEFETRMFGVDGGPGVSPASFRTLTSKVADENATPSVWN